MKKSTIDPGYSHHCDSVQQLSYASVPVPSEPAQTPAAPDAGSEGLLPKPVSTGKCVEICLIADLHIIIPAVLPATSRLAMFYGLRARCR